MFGKNKLWREMLGLFGAGVLVGFVLGWSVIHIIALGVIAVVGLVDYTLSKLAYKDRE